MPGAIQDTNALAAVLERIDGYRDAVVEMQRELCRRPALAPENGGDGEWEKAAWLQAHVETLGLRTERCDAPDPRVSSGVRPNLIATLEGREDGPATWVISHTDVVPPGEASLWTGDPWTLRVDGDRLIGRGVEDNQAGLVASVLSARAFVEAGVRPARRLALALVADEETGSVYGLRHLLADRRRPFGRDDLVIVPDAGNPRGTMIEVAEKSILWVRVHTIGRQAHGSEPDRGRNAHRAAAWMITRMDSLYRRFRRRDPLFDPPVSTFEPTRKEANVPNVNTIPGDDVVYFDCRVLPGYPLRDVVAAIRDIARQTRERFGVRVRLSFPQKEEAAPPTPADAPVVRALSTAIRALRRRRARVMGIGGGTVARYLREAGVPCAVWSTMDERAHTPDEYARISSILDDARVLAHVALQDASSPRKRG